MGKDPKRFRVEPRRGGASRSNSAGWSATRRELLRRISALMGVSLLPGLSACGSGSSSTSLVPPPDPATPPLPAPALESADVQAEASFRNVATATRLDSRFAGLSIEKSKLTVPLFTPDNTPLIELFGALGPSVLRIGANAVDRSSWNGEVNGLLPILPSQVDSFAEFTQVTQWQVIYGVNLARNTPERAAEEAAYVASRLGPLLLAWEIGNEPDLYRRHDYRPDDWGFEDYLAEWQEFREAMMAAVPGVPFSGPSTSYDLERNTLLFAREAGEHLALLTHHYYRAGRNDPDSDLELLLAPDPALPAELAALVEAASEAGLPMGVRLVEANSFFGGGLPGVSNAFGSALWVLDFMFTCAIAGCNGVNLHGGNRGSYTPIADFEGAIVEPRAIFYGMVLFANAAQGVPLEGVVATDADLDFSAWGVQRDDGGLNAVLINKDSERSIGVRLATAVSADRFEALRLEGPELMATDGFTIGGVPIEDNGTWAPEPLPQLAGSAGRLDVIVEPASAVLLRSL